MGYNKIPICFTILFVIIILTGISETGLSGDNTNSRQPLQKGKTEQKNLYANAEITIKIIPSVKKTFGYDIFLYGKPFVHQPNIPALPGNEGFTSPVKAKKVAEFVVKKIRNNEIPPTVTIDDLNKMDVLK